LESRRSRTAVGSPDRARSLGAAPPTHSATARSTAGRVVTPSRAYGVVSAKGPVHGREAGATCVGHCRRNDGREPIRHAPRSHPRVRPAGRRGQHGQDTVFRLAAGARRSMRIIRRAVGPAPGGERATNGSPACITECSCRTLLFRHEEAVEVDRLHTEERQRSLVD
jgi:hypothetical protein